MDDDLVSAASRSNGPAPAGDRATLRFGDFVVHRSRRQLLCDGDTVRIGDRAWDLLNALLDVAGTPLSRQDIEQKVWPGIKVEETSLRVHIASLRKALGDRAGTARFIETVPGRGYRFVAPVLVEAPDDGLPSRVEGWADPTLLPARPAAVVGRQQACDDVMQHLALHRLVTVVGPGGIGKTTVAVQVAERLQHKFPHGSFFFDLSGLTDPASLPSALAICLGLYTAGDRPWPNIRAFIRQRRALIVVDNCEHLRSSAADLVRALLETSAHLVVPATSHEPLQLPAEAVAGLLGFALLAHVRRLDAPVWQRLGVDGHGLNSLRSRAIRQVVPYSFLGAALAAFILSGMGRGSEAPGALVYFAVFAFIATVSHYGPALPRMLIAETKLAQLATPLWLRVQPWIGIACIAGGGVLEAFTDAPGRQGIPSALPMFLLGLVLALPRRTMFVPANALCFCFHTLYAPFQGLNAAPSVLLVMAWALSGLLVLEQGLYRPETRAQERAVHVGRPQGGWRAILLLCTVGLPTLLGWLAVRSGPALPIGAMMFSLAIVASLPASPWRLVLFPLVLLALLATALAAQRLGWRCGRWLLTAAPAQ